MNYKSSMTDIGTAMIASADKAEKAIIFDDFLITEADLSGEKDLTKSTASLFSSPLTYPINSKSTLDNTFTVKAVLANKTEKFTVDQDFNINAIGIMAHIEGDTDSKLMTIAVADGSGAVITAYKNTLYSLTVAITQAYQSDGPTNFKLANVAYALAEDLDKLKTDVQVIIDSDLADVAKTNVDNKFSTTQTLAGGATDGKGNAYATQKDVSQGDASTLASAKGYTDTATKPLATSASVIAGDSSTLASAKAYTDTVGKTKVNVADTSNWQQQALFPKGDYKILAVPSGSDFQSYVMAHLPNPGIYYIRDDTQSGILTDIMLISEGNGSYKMSGLDSQHRFKFRSFDSNTDTGWYVTATDNNGYGAENLIYNSSHLVSLDGWSTNGNGANNANISLGKHNFYHSGQDNLIVITTSNKYNGGSSGDIYTTSKKFAVTPGATMFYSMICFASANVYGVDIYFLGYKADGTMVPALIQSNAKLSPSNAEMRRGFFTVPNDCVTGSFRVDNNGSTDGNSSGVYFVEPQIKEQSIASPYTASPMDFFAYRDGSSREGADLNVDFAPGIHRSDSGVFNGFFGGNSNYYIVWETLLADNNAMIQKEYKNGVTATREYYLGSGWGPWQGTTVDNGNGTITVNGTTYAPVQSDPTSGNIAKVHNFVNGVKINGHLINIDPTNGLTIDGTPLINVVADEATAKAKSANDKLHLWVTKE